MENLKKLVHELENEWDVKKQISILQRINATVLTEYVIEIGDTIIEPLRVEAYYYPFRNAEKFNDRCVHPSSIKVNNFGRLYFIEEKYGYPGVDLCLSLGDYYLSLLIKNSRIGDSYFKQMDLYEKFQDRWEEIQGIDVLHQIPNNKKTVLNTSRIGLNKSRTSFSQALLASVVEIDKKYDWEKGYGKLWTIANYMVEMGLEPTDENIRSILHSYSKEVKAYYEKIRSELK